MIKIKINPINFIGKVSLILGLLFIIMDLFKLIVLTSEQENDIIWLIIVGLIITGGIGFYKLMTEN